MVPPAPRRCGSGRRGTATCSAPGSGCLGGEIAVGIVSARPRRPAGEERRAAVGRLPATGRPSRTGRDRRRHTGRRLRRPPATTRSTGLPPTRSVGSGASGMMSPSSAPMAVADDRDSAISNTGAVDRVGLPVRQGPGGAARRRRRRTSGAPRPAGSASAGSRSSAAGRSKRDVSTRWRARRGGPGWQAGSASRRSSGRAPTSAPGLGLDPADLEQLDVAIERGRPGDLALDGVVGDTVEHGREPEHERGHEHEDDQPQGGRPLCPELPQRGDQPGHQASRARSTPLAGCATGSAHQDDRHQEQDAREQPDRRDRAPWDDDDRRRDRAAPPSPVRVTNGSTSQARSRPSAEPRISPPRGGTCSRALATG